MLKANANVIARAFRLISMLALLVCAYDANAQIRRPTPSPKTSAPQNRPKPLPSASPTASQPMKKASELISKQPPIATNNAILAKVTSDNAPTPSRTTEPPPFEKAMLRSAMPS